MVAVTEIMLHEADEPDVLAHLFDADALASEDGAEIDFASIKADSPQEVTVTVLSCNG